MSDEKRRSVLESLTDEEFAALPPLDPAEIERAIEQGCRDRLAAQKAFRVPMPTRGVRYR